MPSLPKNPHCASCGLEYNNRDNKNWARLLLDIRTGGLFGYRTVAVAFEESYCSVKCAKKGISKLLLDDFSPLGQELSVPRDEAGSRGRRTGSTGVI